MKTYLLELKLSGVKNIEQEIVLNFYNKTIPSEFNSKDSNVKAIYGKNGSGKSAIVNAIDVYKKIVGSNGYLYDENGRNYLNELINYKTNCLKMSFKFITYKRNNKEIYAIHRHTLKLSKDEKTNAISIEEEKLEKVNKSDVSTKTIFNSVNGKIESNAFSAKATEKLTNQLQKRSVVEVIYNDYFNEVMQADPEEYFDKMKEDIQQIFPFMGFASNLLVSLEDSDTHDYFLNTKRKNDENDLNFKQEFIDFGLNDENKKEMQFPGCLHSKIISKKNKDAYLQRIVKVGDFIKLFKPDLEDIVVKFAPFNLESDIAELYFKYKSGYSIYLDFESTGIKKLIGLYDVFNEVENGRIAFIDELDANIHDVFLVKIVEYFSDYAQGQLVFTTHNLGPMEVLDKKKHSLDFLTEESKIVSWKKNGNYSVTRLYRQGLLKDLPFNVSSIDFIGVFGD